MTSSRFPALELKCLKKSRAALHKKEPHITRFPVTPKFSRDHGIGCKSDFISLVTQFFSMVNCPEFLPSSKFLNSVLVCRILVNIVRMSSSFLSSGGLLSKSSEKFNAAEFKGVSDIATSLKLLFFLINILRHKDSQAREVTQYFERAFQTCLDRLNFLVRFTQNLAKMNVVELI